MATKIKASEITRVKRGRKPTVIEGLAEEFAGLKKGEALRLDTEFGGPVTDKSKRSTVSAQIRTHWGRVREDEVSIAFTPEGIPQVTVKA